MNNLKKLIASVFCAFFLIIFGTGCSVYKQVPYFQDLENNKIATDPISNYHYNLVQPRDLLGINVISMNPEVSAIFNYNLNRISGNNNDVSPSNPVTGYLVDSAGMIQIPYMGAVQVGGLTLQQIRDKIQAGLKTYLKDPVVNVRLLNFKVSILGDVLRPDVYTVTEDRFSILDALSKAGDLNITAKRSKVWLIRETDGQRQYIPINLNSKDLFTSSHFYLKNNDVVYVQPGRTKFAGTDRSYKIGSLILSGLSIVAIIVSNL